MPDPITFLDGLTGLALLPVLVALTLLAPGLIRDAIHHLTRKDLPE